IKRESKLLDNESALEYGQERRCIDENRTTDLGLPESELERVQKALQQQSRQTSVPSDELVLVEGFENSVIVHSCHGNLVNEVLAMTLAAIFGSSLGSKIASEVHQ